MDDLFGLIDHLNVGRAFLVGISFGSTVTLEALHREPRRFPRAAVQGGFAQPDLHRRPNAGPCGWAGSFPGTVARLPMRRTDPGVQQPHRVPVAARRPLGLLHRAERPDPDPVAWRIGVDLLTGLDLRPILPEIPTEILLLQGNEDRIVPRRDFEILKAALPGPKAAIMPTVGHQPHMTHAEVLAQLVHQWLLLPWAGRMHRRAAR